MKYFDWNLEKNDKLQNERGISFEDILIAIENGHLLAVIEHPAQTKYLNQKIFIVSIDGYAYIVPFIEDEEEFFLKTIIPSRKMTKKYIIKKEK